MTEEEYERALLNNPELAKYPERENHVPESEADLDKWLRSRIAERLLSKIDNVLMDLVGIESAYGGYRMKSGSSVFNKRLMEKAHAIAAELVDKWLTDYGTIPVKEVTEGDIARSFKYELESATKKAIGDRIGVIVKARAESVSNEVLEAAVDKAMFDTYPILRRMDAAKRLGKKE
jgi:hypothetical protein